MFSRSRWVILVVAAAALLAWTPLQAAEKPAGSWVGTTEVPDQGTDTLTLTLKKISTGYVGELSDSLGMVAKGSVTDVKYADGSLTFSFALTDGANMTMRLKVAGNKMTGEWGHPQGDVGAVTFERKPAKAVPAGK